MLGFIAFLTNDVAAYDLGHSIPLIHRAQSAVEASPPGTKLLGGQMHPAEQSSLHSSENNVMGTVTSGTPSEFQLLEKESYLNSRYGLRSWLLTQDHKRIALLYLFTTSFFFVIGGTAASLIRLELLTPAGDLVTSDIYNKLFSMHGIIMVFFFLVPVAPAVLGNFLIPLMIGAKDVAFPKINLISWYLFVIGGCVELYMMLSGGVDTGWTFHHAPQYTLPQHQCNRRGHGYFHCRLLIHTHWAQLHRHHSPDARPGHDVVSPAVVYLVLLCDLDHLCSRHAGDRDIDGASGVGAGLRNRCF